MLRFVITNKEDEMKTENMLGYVVRKLNDKAFNCSEAARRTELGRSTLSELATGKAVNPSLAVVQKLYDHFKSLAD